MDGDEQVRYHGLGDEYWALQGKYDLVVEWATGYLTGHGVVLDLGCGPGNLLGRLSNLGQTVLGLDNSMAALMFARTRSGCPVAMSSSESIPLASSSVDAIFMLDVLEHVRDDQRALREIYRVLRPGGTLILTVPAFSLLWGTHDQRYGHYRRYRTGDLLRALGAARLRPMRCFYFEASLFLPLLVFRQIKRLLPNFGAESDDFVRVPAWANRTLARLVVADGKLATRLRPPIGVSLFCAARKR